MKNKNKKGIGILLAAIMVISLFAAIALTTSIAQEADNTVTTLKRNCFGDPNAITAEVLSEIFYEEFEGTFPPYNWTVINNIIVNPVWERNDVTGRRNYAGTGYCAIADSDYYEYYLMNTDLISPLINCTGLSNISLTFDTDYQNYAGYDWAFVRVRSSATGGTWKNHFSME